MIILYKEDHRFRTNSLMKVTLISDIYKFHNMRGRAGEVGLQVSRNFTNDLKPVEGLSGRRSSRPPLSPTSAFEAQLQNMVMR